MKHMSILAKCNESSNPTLSASPQSQALNLLKLFFSPTAGSPFWSQSRRT
jgi:hypothetical protein